MEEKPTDIIGWDTSLKEPFRTLRLVAPRDTTVLVTGESGTGKELAVRTLHAWSRRSGHPLVPVNCGAIPRDLLESELFGHEKGAFTGAHTARLGRFREAEHGTLFLDEIGELEKDLQAKILRALQEKEIEPVGASRPVKVDVRIVAATNRDLDREVEKGNFRSDLYYRLNVIPVTLPPLRERGDDILLLARTFLHRFCERDERSELRLSDEVCSIFMRYDWPGNVRELENYMERMSALVEGDVLLPEDLPGKVLQGVERIESGGAAEPKSAVAAAGSGEFAMPTLADLEKSGLGLKEFLEKMEMGLVAEAMAEAKGVHQDAARRLGMKRTTLIEKLRRRDLHQQGRR
ncbi:MAG: sigma-54 dependent transcriptional regulator [Desulfovibrionaceae bacterium]|nr:sigma-54 dependent transcriptional regulator [Desulfovibrionaceae bacterium]